MANKKKNTFEQELRDLESIVDRLESGDLDLEESLKKYDEGVKLICSLNKKLEDSKLKIQELSGKIEKDCDDLSDTELSHA